MHDKRETRDIGKGLQATVVDEFTSCRWFIFRDEGRVRTVLEEKRARNPEEAWKAVHREKRKWLR